MIKLKKIGLVIVASIFVFAAFAVGGCGAWQDYVFREGDFLLEVLVDRNTAFVGDTIKITVKLVNNSGKTLPVVFANGILSDSGELRNSLLTGLTTSKEHRGGFFSDKHTGTSRRRLRDGDSVSVSRNHIIDVLEIDGVYYVRNFASAIARFSIGRESNEPIIIKSNNVVEIIII